MPTEINTLGLRCVSGDQEHIHQIKQLAGTSNQVPDQNANPLSQPPRYEIKQKEFREQLTKREHELEDLLRQYTQIEEHVLRADGQLEILKDLFLDDKKYSSL